MGRLKCLKNHFHWESLQREIKALNHSWMGLGEAQWDVLYHVRKLRDRTEISYVLIMQGWWWWPTDKAELLTYPAADCDQELPHGLGVIHHHRLHRAIQHSDFLRPLFLLVLQNVLDKSPTHHTQSWKTGQQHRTLPFGNQVQKIPIFSFVQDYF